MHEQTTKEFGKMNICMSILGVRIGWRKYLNECTPFGYVSLLEDKIQTSQVAISLPSLYASPYGILVLISFIKLMK